MEITIEKLGEAGHDAALYGLGLSYGITSNEPWVGWQLYDPPSYKRMMDVARKLTPKDDGHNKFLESIQTWWLVRAPRYFWSEFDTYRVGMTKQSESTMHTIHRGVAAGDFEESDIDANDLLKLNTLIKQRPGIDIIKRRIPEGFMQRRQWCCSYKVLRHIIGQRHDHRLPHWPEFCRRVMEQVEHPYYLEDCFGK